MRNSLFNYFIYIHVVSSSLFLLLGIFVLWRSLRGWIKQMVFTSKDKLLNKSFLILLYFELFMGIILFFFVKRPDEIANVNEAVRNSSLRYWAIIHFSSMTFALFFCQIGWIFLNRAKSSENKFKYTFIYYGTVILITVITLGYYILRKY
ncbi:MAG: hypothetical protein J7K46_12910 [Bacteroidales bacterium]|nr:hypothetical protein [Bacteroidales bacterium]